MSSGSRWPPRHGIVGYVFSTGQPIALTDVASDPRFDKGTAERTGYLPRSIAAVPLVDAGATVGVLQVLDKHSSDAFSLKRHGPARRLRAPGGGGHRGGPRSRAIRSACSVLCSRPSATAQLDDEALDALVGEAAAELDRDDEAPFWRLVDRVARLRSSSDADLELIEELLEVVARHRAHTDRGVAAGDRAAGGPRPAWSEPFIGRRPRRPGARGATRPHRS